MSGEIQLNFSNVYNFTESLVIIGNPLVYMEKFIADMVYVANCQAQTITNKLQAIIRFYCWITRITD